MPSPHIPPTEETRTAKKTPRDPQRSFCKGSGDRQPTVSQPRTRKSSDRWPGTRYPSPIRGTGRAAEGPPQPLKPASGPLPLPLPKGPSPRHMHERAQNLANEQRPHVVRGERIGRTWLAISLGRQLEGDGGGARGKDEKRGRGRWRWNTRCFLIGQSGERKALDRSSGVGNPGFCSVLCSFFFIYILLSFVWLFNIGLAPGTAAAHVRRGSTVLIFLLV